MPCKVPKRHQLPPLGLGFGGFEGYLPQEDIQSVVVGVFKDDDLIVGEAELCQVLAHRKFVDEDLVKVLVVLFIGHLAQFVVPAADDDHRELLIVRVVARLSHRVNYGVLHRIFKHGTAEGLRG